MLFPFLHFQFSKRNMWYPKHIFGNMWITTGLLKKSEQMGIQKVQWLFGLHRGGRLN